LGFRLDRDTTLLDPYLFNDLKYQFIPPIETKIQYLTKKREKKLTLKSKNKKNPQIRDPRRRRKNPF
jgi:hypothetical protein